MRTCIYAIFASALLCAAACTEEKIVEVKTDTPEATEKPLDGELFVKFTPEVSDIIEKYAQQTRSTTRSGVLSVDEVMQTIGSYQIERVFPIDSRHEERTREAELNQWYLVRFDSEHSVADVAKELSVLGEVQCVNYNHSIKRAYNGERKAQPLTRGALAARTATTRALPDYPFNDELLPDQWHLINRGNLFVADPANPKSVAGADVQCEEAWKLTTGDPSIVVAVLDEGICYDHPDLKNSMWRNEGEEFRSNKDNDNNGYAGDLYGYNFVSNTGVISYENYYDSGHGTHVAGVIAAQNDNGIGISSVAGGTPTNPGVKVMSCQIFSGNTASNLLAEVKAIKYAADNGAVVLQCSWGYVAGTANSYDWGTPGPPTEEDWETGNSIEKAALEYFIHNAGSPNGPIDGGVAIFAGGNENANSTGFPGAAEDCISVTATAADFTPAVYTNYGKYANIAAPGGDQDYYFDYFDDTHARGLVGCVLSTVPYQISETGYGYMEGTSMACPHVSGVAALGLSYAMKLRKHFTAAEFKKMLCESTTPIDSYLSGLKNYYRYVAEVGLNQPMQLVLSNYRNGMGGQVNATKLFRAIDGGGVQMTFPNIYVPLTSQVVAIPANYFVGGESLTYTVAIEDNSVATCTITNGKAAFTGLKLGSTKATITASNGTVHAFNITVRRAANGSGWL